MNLRRRVVLLTSAALSVVVALMAALAYVLVRHETYRRLDVTLSSRAAVLAPVVREGTLSSPRLPIVAVPDEYVQTVTSTGKIARPPYQAVVLPSDTLSRQVAAGNRDAFSRTIAAAGIRMRVRIERVAPGLAIEVARPLSEDDATLRRLRVVLLLLAGSGLVVSIGLGYWIAETALVAVRRLTAAAERTSPKRTADLPKPRTPTAAVRSCA